MDAITPPKPKVLFVFDDFNPRVFKSFDYRDSAVRRFVAGNHHLKICKSLA